MGHELSLYFDILSWNQTFCFAQYTYSVVAVSMRSTELIDVAAWFPRNVRILICTILHTLVDTQGRSKTLIIMPRPIRR